MWHHGVSLLWLLGFTDWSRPAQLVWAWWSVANQLWDGIILERDIGL